MLVKIEFTSTAPSEEIIDLKDYGYDSEIDWDDLTYEQQCEVTDSLCEQWDVIAGGEPLNFKDNESTYEEYYDEEEMEIIESKFS